MTPEMLSACTGATAAHAIVLAPLLTAAMDEAAINTPQRQAIFLAQVGHESEGLLYMAEIWGPTLAQLHYDPPFQKAAELGNTERGDGKRFKGRGPIQITGRFNYRKYGAVLGMDLEQFPELLEDPAAGCRASSAFWQANGLNELADSEQFITITRRINGGTNGLDDRQKRWAAAKLAMGIA